MLSIESPALLTPAVPDPNLSAKPSKLHSAAQQFEALMIGELLKGAREDSSEGWLGGGEDSGSESAMDLAQSQFASALASRGGIGLASMIEQKMTPHLDQKTAEKPEPAPAGSLK